jgi:hypothetical protein
VISVQDMAEESTTQGTRQQFSPVPLQDVYNGYTDTEMVIDTLPQEHGTDA